MPRITNDHYLDYRTRLRQDWTQQAGLIFSYLPVADQQHLHLFFAPSQPFTDTEAVQYRQQIGYQYPSLPQRAGRAYQRFLTVATREPWRTQPASPTLDAARPRRTPKHHHVRVRPIAKSTLDPYEVARLLKFMADSGDYDDLIQQTIDAKKPKPSS